MSAKSRDRKAAHLAAENAIKEMEYCRRSSQKQFTLKNITLLCTIGACLLIAILHLTGVIDLSGMGQFNTVFISILMQAFPFMLIGVLVSSVMHVFIPDEWVVKLFPTKHGIGFITAMFAGIFFPVCECAIVPVMTRLVKKGVAMPIAITFMLSAPIINPIVIISTFYAFDLDFKWPLIRVGLGLLTALVIGLIMLLFQDKLAMIPIKTKSHEHEHTCSCHCHTGCDNEKKTFAQKLKIMFLHAGEEFFGVGKYLIIGAFITSMIQMLIPKSVFDRLSMQSWLSILIMMFLAFVFSACSTSDAFIAKSYVSKFPKGAVMSFLVYGPMMDVKNLLMLSSNFKKGSVIKLAVLITVVNILIMSIASIFLLNGGLI